jgi:hypothetical protein
MRLAGQILDPIGSPATVIVEGTASPAVIARKGTNEFAVSLIGDEAWEAMVWPGESKRQAASMSIAY